MTIIKWRLNPESERSYQRGITRNESEMAPNCGCDAETNIRKFNDHYLIDMAVPGRSKAEFSISLEDDIITISYEKKETEHDANAPKYLHREFDNSSFSRNFRLPEIVDKESISARYEDGILSVRIPFEDPEKNRISRSIQVN